MPDQGTCSRKWLTNSMNYLLKMSSRCTTDV